MLQADMHTSLTGSYITLLMPLINIRMWDAYICMFLLMTVFSGLNLAA